MPKNPEPQICHVCFEWFLPKLKANRKLIKYCGNKCRQADYRNRNAEVLRDRQRAWHINHPDRSSEIKKKWNDKPDSKKLKKQWYEDHKEEVFISFTTNPIARKKSQSRGQANRVIERLGRERICSEKNEECDGRIELHHKDGDAFNNEIDNLIYLCRKHHMDDHRYINLKKKMEKDNG